MILGVVIFLIVFIALISSIWPKQEELFFELGLLDKDKTANSYFFNDSSIIDPGTVNSWFIYVYNHMDTFEVISVRVKLLNSTMNLPVDQEYQSSQVDSFVEFPLSLSINETVLVPFSWSIIDIESQNDLIVIKRLMINNQRVDVEVSGPVTSIFRVVFELWVQDHTSGEYVFGWESTEGFSFASLYMGFELG